MVEYQNHVWVNKLVLVQVQYLQQQEI